jgi:formylglycine-generating enzyme required for sulfatase activity
MPPNSHEEFLEVLIPPGTVRMGSPEEEKDRGPSEGPVHEVAITRPFHLGVYPVTQEQYQRVMGSNPSYFCPRGEGKDEVAGMDTRLFPVESVSWEEAVAFCAKLSALPEEKRSGRVYRLPSEAEWEYCCRGGAASYQVFHFGNSLSSMQANFVGPYPDGNADKGTDLGRTCKVGSYAANRVGLHDMHGNVWEWCHDWFDEYSYGRSQREDPSGPSEDSDRVIRGGSWNDIDSSCRSAYGGMDCGVFRDGILGCRVALVPSGG